MASSAADVSSSEKIVMIELVVAVIERFPVQKSFVSWYDGVVSVPKGLGEACTPAHLKGTEYKEVIRDVSSCQINNIQPRSILSK